jgi:MFS family permease
MCGADLPTGQRDEEAGAGTVPAWKNPAVRAVFLALFTSCVGGAAVVPVIPFHARSLGASPAMVGYMFSAWSLAEIVGTPVAASAMDRFGRRPVLLASLALHSAAAAIAGSATGLNTLLVSRFLAGFGSSGGSVYQVILTDLCTKDQQAAALARLAAVPPAAMLFGPLLGGYIAQQGYAFTFYAEAVLKAMAFMCVMFYVKNGAIKGADTSKVVERAPVPFAANVLGIASFLTGVFVGTAISMLAVTLEARYGYSQLETSYFITCRSGIMLVVRSNRLCRSRRLQLDAPVERRLRLQELRSDLLPLPRTANIAI